MFVLLRREDWGPSCRLPRYPRDIRRNADGRGCGRQGRRRIRPQEDCALRVPWAALSRVHRIRKLLLVVASRRPHCPGERGRPKQRGAPGKWPGPRHERSSPPAEEAPKGLAESGEFAGNTPAQKKAVTVVVQAKSGGEAQRPAGR